MTVRLNVWSSLERVHVHQINSHQRKINVFVGEGTLKSAPSKTNPSKFTLTCAPVCTWHTLCHYNYASIETFTCEWIFVMMFESFHSFEKNTRKSSSNIARAARVSERQNKKLISCFADFWCWFCSLFLSFSLFFLLTHFVCFDFAFAVCVSFMAFLSSF